MERNRVAPTPHKANAFFRRIGVPVPTGKKSVAKTFDLYQFLDWFLGEFLPGKIIGMESDDGTLKMSSLPNDIDQLKKMHVMAQTEMANVKIAKERMALVPVRELNFVMHAIGERFNRFGEKLKSQELYELLENYNEIIADSIKQFEGMAQAVIKTHETVQ